MPSTQSAPSPPSQTAPAAAQALVRGARDTLAEQLAARYAERIEQRLLAPGARLPSVRQCAAHHGLSPSTVVDAYDLLQARGLVQARPQRGFFVREHRPQLASLAPPEGVRFGPGDPDPKRGPQLASLAPPEGVRFGPGDPDPKHGPQLASLAPPEGVRFGPGYPDPKHGPQLAAASTSTAGRGALPAPIDATALIRGMFLAQGGLPAPGMGTLPEAWLDATILQRALRRVCDEPSAWLRYGEPAGDARLRAALSQRLADLGVRAAPEQIVTTVGATHALDIVARTLLQPGDAVLVDEPGWAVEYARLSAMGMRLLPVPRGPEGPDLAVLDALARAHRPRLYVGVSVLHNPTGQSLSAAHAHRLLLLAQEHGLTLVEDDSYAWFAPPHAPRLSQLDGLQRTVYVSGFSKIVTPQWRVGFLAAAPALAERFIDTKLIGTLSSPGPLERAMALCLEQGSLRRHAERVTERLAAARERTARLVREAGCRFVTPPAGLFGWIDVGTDTETLATTLLDDGWLTAPGHLFHAAPRPGPLMRVNFATAQDARFWRRLKTALR